MHDPSLVQEEAAEQERWLNKVLSSPKTKKSVHTFVFQHRPPYVDSHDEEKTNDNLKMDTRMEHLNLLQSHGVTALFVGHLHYGKINRYKDLEIVSTGPAGFRVVKVYRDHIEHEYYPLHRVPELIEL